MGECGTARPTWPRGCAWPLPPETAGAFHHRANLVNELVEAQQQGGVRRVLARWMRYDLIALDEVGYVPLAEIGAEFLFRSSPNGQNAPR